MIWGSAETIVVMTRSGVVSDELWALVESVMPSDVGKRGRRFGDHRLILEGIAWRFRTGSPWRDLPAAYGSWQTVYGRHRTWSGDGTWDRVEHFHADCYVEASAPYGDPAG